MQIKKEHRQWKVATIIVKAVHNVRAVIKSQTTQEKQIYTYTK